MICLKSIYQKILGNEYEKMHPQLQQRYHLTLQKGFRGKGIMDSISGGTFFVRQFLKIGVKYRLFFSERGKEVPFTIINKVVNDEKNRQVVHWNRTFQFERADRHFDAVMYLDDKEQEIIDDFGVPAVLTSTLQFQVDEKGSVHITSKKQWLKLFHKRLPLPKLLYGVAHIVESYDDERECFVISVEVRNPLVGTIFAYQGTFKEDIDYEK